MSGERQQANKTHKHYQAIPQFNTQMRRTTKGFILFPCIFYIVMFFVAVVCGWRSTVSADRVALAFIFFLLHSFSLPKTYIYFVSANLPQPFSRFSSSVLARDG